MKLKNILLTILATSSAIIYSSLTLTTNYCNNTYLSKACKKIPKFVFTLTKPPELFLDGLVSLKAVINGMRTNNDISILDFQIKSKIPGTIERFTSLKPGFNFNYEPNNNPDIGYLLLSRASPYDGAPSIELWDLNSQKPLNKFNINESEILEKLKLASISDQRNLRLFHPLLLSDGSIITLSEPEPGTLLKFNKCGELIAFNNDHNFHHSIEIDKNGNIYVPIEKVPYELPYKSSYPESYRNEGFAILDEDLNEKSIYSISEILSKGGLLRNSIATYSDNFIDPFHLNDVHPFIGKNQETSVFLSLRHYGLIRYNLDKDKMVWAMIGLTNYQHDITPYGMDGEIITVFDNGFEKTAQKEEFNKVIKISNLPTTAEKTNFYLGEKLNEQKLKLSIYDFSGLDKNFWPNTKTEGRGRLLNNKAAIFVEETNHGRIFEQNLNTKKILWTFLNVKEKGENPTFLSWSRRYENLPNDLDVSIYNSCKSR